MEEMDPIHIEEVDGQSHVLMMLQYVWWYREWLARRYRGAMLLSGSTFDGGHVRAVDEYGAAGVFDGDGAVSDLVSGQSFFKNGLWWSI